MGKRTSQTGLPDWDDAPDLDALVRDKRQEKRANPAKGRRRNRRIDGMKTACSVPNSMT